MDAPEHYRQRTEIARRMATEMTDEDLRERMEMVAEEYDQMALNSEAPHTKKPAEASDPVARFAACVTAPITTNL